MGADHDVRVDDCLVIFTCGFLSNNQDTQVACYCAARDKVVRGDLVIITLCRSHVSDRRVVDNLQKAAAHEECQYVFKQ